MKNSAKVVMLGLPFYLCNVSGALAQSAYSIQASIGSSDNITMAAEGDEKIDETIRAVGAQFALIKETERTTTNLAGTVTNLSYGEGSFSSETISGLNVDFNADLIEGSLSWAISDNYGQALVDPFSDPTPSNREDINVLTTGPTWRVAAGERNTLILNYELEDVSYGTNPFSYSRDGGSVRFERQFSSTLILGLGVNDSGTDFSDFLANSYDQQDAYLRAQVQGARTTLTVDVGTTEVRTETTMADGGLFSVELERQIDSDSRFIVEIGKNFSNSGNIFRLGQVNSLLVGQNFDLFPAADPFENEAFDISYQRSTDSSNIAVRLFRNREDYVTLNEFDRSSKGFQLSVLRRFDNPWEISASVRLFDRTFEVLADSDDRITQASLRMSRRASSAMRWGVAWDYMERDLQRIGGDARDIRYFVFVNYGSDPATILPSSVALR